MGFFFRSTEPDPATGIMEDVYLGYGPDEGKVRFDRRQNIDEELRYAHESRQNEGKSFAKHDGMYKAAKIPLVEVERWRAEHGFDLFKTTDRERKDWINKMAKRWKAKDITL